MDRVANIMKRAQRRVELFIFSEKIDELDFLCKANFDCQHLQYKVQKYAPYLYQRDITSSLPFVCSATTWTNKPMIQSVIPTRTKGDVIESDKPHLCHIMSNNDSIRLRLKTSKFPKIVPNVEQIVETITMFELFVVRIASDDACSD